MGTAMREMDCVVVKSSSSFDDGETLLCRFDVGFFADDVIMVGCFLAGGVLAGLDLGDSKSSSSLSSSLDKPVLTGGFVALGFALDFAGGVFTAFDFGD